MKEKRALFIGPSSKIERTIHERTRIYGAFQSAAKISGPVVVKAIGESSGATSIQLFLTPPPARQSRARTCWRLWSLTRTRQYPVVDQSRK